MTSDRLGTTRGSEATAFAGTSSSCGCRTLDSVGTSSGRVALRGPSRCFGVRCGIAYLAVLRRVRSRLRTRAFASVRSPGIWVQSPDRRLVPSNANPHRPRSVRRRTLSACDHRRTRNRHGPGESDCLIKTKHRDSPCEGSYAM